MAMRRRLALGGSDGVDLCRPMAAFGATRGLLSARGKTQARALVGPRLAVAICVAC